MTQLERKQYNAFKNRQEIVKANLSRRDLWKMGLLTTAGYLVAKNGLSVRAIGGGGIPTSPPTRSFIEAMPRMTVKQPTTLAALTPAPTQAPNTAINPATGLAFEGRTVAHQAWTTLPVQKYYQVTQQLTNIHVSPDLPLQPLWTFDGLVPGPVYHAKYGEPILVRNVNNLPTNNGGFGLNSVSTHLHNGHTPPESDGFPCYFFEKGQYYDHHYPNVLAGFSSTNPPNGDINESMSTLWYHDHRVDFTSQNVYKGLAGMYLLFNQFDTGDETTGFHLPSGDYDVPILFGDRYFDQTSHLMAFDLFNLDGILGDKFLANGIISPFFQVAPRRYRFRLLNGGPSRFYQFFLTDLNNLGAVNNFWQIATDGNLLPKPLLVSNTIISVAERNDIIIDFSAYTGKSIYLENRMEQTDGRGPTGNVLQAGRGNLIIRFDVVLPPVADNSGNPATQTFYALPDKTAVPRVTRTFRFERNNGQWAVNGQFADCKVNRFTVQKNSVEQWIIQNNSGGWMHPVHIHFEEFQFISRNGVPPSGVEITRKDVVRLQHNEQVIIKFRFRDFVGRLPIHCHNVVHEDHSMMALWSIADVGDTNPLP